MPYTENLKIFQKQTQDLELSCDITLDTGKRISFHCSFLWHVWVHVTARLGTYYSMSGHILQHVWVHITVCLDIISQHVWVVITARLATYYSMSGYILQHVWVHYSMSRYILQHVWIHITACLGTCHSMAGYILQHVWVHVTACLGTYYSMSGYILQHVWVHVTAWLGTCHSMAGYILHIKACGTVFSCLCCDCSMALWKTGMTWNEFGRWVTLSPCKDDCYVDKTRQDKTMTLFVPLFTKIYYLLVW